MSASICGCREEGNPVAFEDDRFRELVPFRRGS
jgi:hypothetical protein